MISLLIGIVNVCLFENTPLGGRAALRSRAPFGQRRITSGSAAAATTEDARSSHASRIFEFVRCSPA
jgi:hypothetical protein